MRILVGWDNPAEAETIELCLHVDESSAAVLTESDRFETVAAEGGWDVVLMALNFPNEDDAFALFQRIRTLLPNTPVVGAWHQGEIVKLARFIRNGLQSHITRDQQGEFVFLLTAMLEAAHAAAIAERSRVLAERLREEVDSVRRLQESVIPRNLPVPAGYQVAARYEPSQINVVGSRPVVMAGGDYYDVFALNETTMVLLVGDASGHGVKACMSIMTMHTLIRLIREQRYPETVQFVSAVNRQLCENDIVRDDGGFITLLYCTLDSTSHCLQWTAAGHPMPLLQNLETNEIVQLGSEEEGGLPLGIDEDWTYEMCAVSIPDNSRVLLYSDGLEEAFPEGGSEDDQFGVAGIMASLRSSAELSVGEALETLFADSAGATAGAGRHDDTSVVLLERKSSSQ